jgi:hypothetical protein
MITYTYTKIQVAISKKFTENCTLIFLFLWNIRVLLFNRTEQEKYGVPNVFFLNQHFSGFLD